MQNQTGVPLQVDYTRVAAHIREMQPRALRPEQYEDVVTLLEYMRDELVQRQTELEATTLLIEQRERDVAQREKDASIRSKVAFAAASLGKKQRRWWTYLTGMKLGNHSNRT